MSELRRASDAGKISWLQSHGAGSLEHTNRLFIDHLIATRNLLKKWGAREFVQDAGLFHSVYGTQFFKHALINREMRSEVAQLIGGQAEQLVYQFCSFPREFIVEAIWHRYCQREPFNLETPFYFNRVSNELIQIFFANEFEQTIFSGKNKLGSYLDLFLNLNPFQSEDSLEDVRRVVGVS